MPNETHEQCIVRLLMKNGWIPEEAQDFFDTVRAMDEDAKQEATQRALDEIERQKKPF